MFLAKTLYIISLCADQLSTRRWEIRSRDEMYPSASLRSISVRSVVECAGHCQEDCRCQSFAYQHSQHGPSCYLLNTHFSRLTTPQNSTGYVIYDWTCMEAFTYYRILFWKVVVVIFFPYALLWSAYKPWERDRRRQLYYHQEQWKSGYCWKFSDQKLDLAKTPLTHWL